MTIAIENKWKRFALMQVFSDWYENSNLDDIFDDMQLEDEQGMTELFDEHDVIVWEALEDMPLVELAEYATQLAESAQNTSYWV